MKNLLILLLLMTPLLAEPKEGEGLDKETKDKMHVIRKEAHIQKQRLHIAMQKKEIELKEILLEGHDMSKIKINCEERGEIWAKLQLLSFETDAKVKTFLTDEQFHRYIMRKKARHHQKAKMNGNKPHKKPGMKKKKR